MFVCVNVCHMCVGVQEARREHGILEFMGDHGLPDKCAGMDPGSSGRVLLPIARSIKAFLV